MSNTGPTNNDFELINLNSESLHYLHPTPTPTAKPEISQDGRRATLVTKKGSDWWHTPERDSQDGLVWGRWMDLGEGGFEVRVKASIAHRDRVCHPFHSHLPHSQSQSQVPLYHTFSMSTYLIRSLSDLWWGGNVS